MDYVVFDTEYKQVATFKDGLLAHCFKSVFGNPNWIIKEYSRESTEKQKSAVSFIESILNVKFNGDINDFYDCRLFLNMYLEEAKDKIY